MRATRIEHHEIEQFVTHCTRDETRWIIDGIDFGSSEEWRFAMGCCRKRKMI